MAQVHVNNITQLSTVSSLVVLCSTMKSVTSSRCLRSVRHSRSHWTERNWRRSSTIASRRWSCLETASWARRKSARTQLYTHSRTHNSSITRNASCQCKQTNVSCTFCSLSATTRHFSTISTNYEKEAEAVLVWPQFPVLIYSSPLHCSTDSWPVSWYGMASVVDGKNSVAGELKETGQRLLTEHAHTCADTHNSAVTGWALSLLEGLITLWLSIS